MDQIPLTISVLKLQKTIRTGKPILPTLSDFYEHTPTAQIEKIVDLKRTLTVEYSFENLPLNEYYIVYAQSYSKEKNELIRGMMGWYQEEQDGACGWMKPIHLTEIANGITFEVTGIIYSI